MMQIQNKKIIIDLFNVGAIRFGNFVLKSGATSPIYIDLRRIISFPKLVKEIRDALWRITSHLEFNLICGVPYAALPLATALSLEYNIPMLMQRKEVKKHGIKASVEGVFSQKQLCLVVEDVMTTGASIFETVVPLQKEKVLVKDVCVVLNRKQSDVKTIQDRGLMIHSLLSIYEVLEVLYTEQKITKELLIRVTHFLKE